MNNRRSFLKTTGLIGAAAVLPFGTSLADDKTKYKLSDTCVLIPSETAGPFPLDLSENTFYFRQDVSEDKTGVQLNLKMKILGLENCEPMQNVRVNIWHCDKDGAYSGYSLASNPGQAGLTYCRGYQITDVGGEVGFITILPGWYPGRTCHIHFQVFVSSSYSAVSQLTFDAAIKNEIYAANPSIYTKGADPTSIQGDNVFTDGYQYQLATLTPNPETGGWDSYLEVTVKGSGTVGVGNSEKETAKQFSLGQNFPNPYSGFTTIPFKLYHMANVKILIWDLSGKIVAEIPLNNLNEGEYQIPVELDLLGLSAGSYVYELETRGISGTYKQFKMMTGVK